MTVIHIVLFKFLPTTTSAQKQTFINEVKTLKSLSCVKDSRLIVGGPSVSNPIESSKGYEYALVSFHEDRIYSYRIVVRKMSKKYPGISPSREMLKVRGGYDRQVAEKRFIYVDTDISSILAKRRQR